MIKNDLQRYYRKLMIPVISLVIISAVIKMVLPVQWTSDEGAKAFGIFLFTLSTISSLVSPLLYRLVFIRRFKLHHHVPHKNFLSFQKNTLRIALATFYIFILALITSASDLIYVGIFLLSLYSAYFYFPSQRRIDFEIRLFRVED